MPAEGDRGFDCLPGLQDMVTGRLQNFAGDLADKFFVLDQENRRASGWRLQVRGRGVGFGDGFEFPGIVVNDRSDVDEEWLGSVRNVGVTAGASAPEHLVQELIEFLGGMGFRQMEEIELVDEDVRFSLPAELTVSIR